MAGRRNRLVSLQKTPAVVIPYSKRVVVWFNGENLVGLRCDGLRRYGAMRTRQEASGGSMTARVQRHAGRARLCCDRSGRGQIAPRRFAARVAISALLLTGTVMSRAQEPAA